jgi:hypothetical protein
MLMFKLERTGPIWGLTGFILGAALAGTAVGALGHSGPTLLSPSSYEPQTEALDSNADAALVLPQRVIASVVKIDEIEAAINNFSAGLQRKVRNDVASGKYRLLWLTVWDWDTAVETGDTISILSDDVRQYVTLNSRRTRIAIPEPRSGYIEIRGEVPTVDGNISISILSGTHPIALPRMPSAQAIRLQIDS